MRYHPERTRDTYNARKDLGLSPRARFCVVIRQENVVIEMYPGVAEVESLTDRAIEILMQTDKATSFGILKKGEEYSWVGGGETKIHAVNDGIICKSPVQTA